MKRILTSRIFLVVLTAIIVATGSVYATIRIQADEIGYQDGTVGDALDTLYTDINTTITNLEAEIASLRNGNINVGTLKFAQSLGDQTTSRSTTINNLPKGQYIFVLISESGLSTASSSITDVNSTITQTSSPLNLTCTSCTSTMLSAKYYHTVASASNTTYTASGRKLNNDMRVVIYFVNVTSDTNSFTATRTASWSGTWSPQGVIMNAIPLSIS